MGGNNGDGKTENKRGRPTKFTEDKARAVIEAVRRGCYVHTAAAIAGVHKGTVYNWLSRGEQEDDGPYRDFFNALKEAEANCENDALNNIITASKKDWKAAAWYLERTKRGTYARPPTIIKETGGDKPQVKIPWIKPENDANSNGSNS